MRTDVLGVAFDDVTMEQAVERASAMLAAGGFHYAVTPNVEFVQRAAKEERFRCALNGADMVLPDGIGVLRASQILDTPLKGRVAGCDFAAALCARMAADGRKLFLLGAKPGVAERAAHNLEAAYPGLTVCGAMDGYFTDGEAAAQAVRQSGAEAVFVCLGAPRQEYWIVEHGPKTGAAFLIGLGGSLDVFAGAVKRAPEGWRRLGLEWLYRLIHQPSRAGRMVKLPLFLVSALREKERRNRHGGKADRS